MTVPSSDLAYGALGLAIIAIIFGIWGVAQARSVKRRYLSVFGTDKPESVERLVSALHERVDTAVDQFDGLSSRIGEAETQLTRGISRMGLVRFNPFMDTGSDLSFSLALLNDNGDGIVLTSLWGRDEVRLYAKPIDHHESRYVLSQEEKQALDLARNQRRDQLMAQKA